MDQYLSMIISVVYVPTLSNDKDEFEQFHMDVEKFHGEDDTFFTVMAGDVEAKIGPRRTSQHWYSRIRMGRAG
uniref:EthD domain-containing protein n=1 Tax=Angiostrongylus cantonensis TaxID=6313 RepID=A0A0K0DAF2_ANGCA